MCITLYTSVRYAAEMAILYASRERLKLFVDKSSSFPPVATF